MGISSSTAIHCVLLAVLVSSSHLRDLESLPKFWNDHVAGPIVDLGYAQYEGSTDLSTNISSFLSIRYAAPPTGKPILYLLLFELTISPGHDSMSKVPCGFKRLKRPLK